MKTHNPCYMQSKYWDVLLQQIGCIVCNQQYGIRNYDATLYQINDEDSYRANWLVVPLCEQHKAERVRPGLIVFCAAQLDRLGYTTQRNALAELFKRKNGATV